MGFVSGFKRVAKPFVNVTGWMSFNLLKAQTKSIKDIADDLFTPKEAQREESFENALNRLKMTQQDVAQRIVQFRRLVIFFTIIIIILLGYFIYLLSHGAWKASLGCLGITLVMVGQTFRYHFWLFQLRERRLGCSFKEWLDSLIGSKK